MHNTFAHGVASGDPTGEAVVIWTRLSGQAYPAEVAWEVALNPGFARIAASGYTTATAERDWTVHVDVHGLRSATTYYYRFQAAGQQSPRGRTRTLGTGPIEHARFAFMSCAKFNAGHFNVYSRVAARDDLDFLLHLGDYIYEASNTPPASQTPGADIGRPFDPLHECVTLDDYRTRYRQYHRDPMVQRVHASLPFICAADDHDLADAAWRGGAAEHKPEYGPWEQRLADACRARQEWLPPRHDPADSLKVHQSVRAVGLADPYVLDTR